MTTINNPSPSVKDVWVIDLPKVTIPTLDMATSKLKPSVTAYKNNLANALHGLDTVRALDLSACDPDDYEKVLLAHQAKQKSHIDGCSGSRKKGIVFTSTAPIGEGVVERYFSGSKRVTHGSILFSECRKMFHLESLCYQVQTDDSPGLGDCHGMIAQSLYTQLQDFYPLGNDTCIQFRFGVKDKWLAKGTVLPYPDSYLPDGVALVLPDSCFKGKCPDLHTTQCDDVIFGILHTSKVGRYKTSHQVLQCFVNPDSQQYLVDKAVESMTALIASRNTTTSFAQHMLECMAKDPTDTIDCFPASLNDGFDDNDQQEDPMPLLTVVAADQYYQLHSHPTVVSKLNDLFRRRVVEIATGKHLTATGLMANPLVNLKPGYVISNSLPTGEYLMFRYPVRHYGDIKVIKLVNPNDPLDIDGHVVDPKRKLIAALNGGLSKLSDHQTYFATHTWRGTFAIQPDYALEVGMDFDGDTVAFMPCSHHPILAKEAKSWKPLPAIQKPEKKPHTKSLIEVIAESMRNSIGILASMMTKCRFFGLTSEYAYLGEQEQLVVDNLKSDTGVDHDYIAQLRGKLKKLVDEQLNADLVPWFTFYKDKTIFINGNVPTIAPEHRHDTISQLFAAVGELYQGENSPFTSGINEQYSFIFEEIYPYLTPLTIGKCEKYYARYIKQVSDIINSFPPEGERTPAQDKAMGKLIGLVIDEWVAWADDLKAKLTDQQIMCITGGFWKIIHSRRNSGSANIIFRMFPQQVMSRLETFRGNSFRIRKGDDGMSAAVYEDSPMLGMVVRVDDDYYLYIKDGDDYALFGEVISSALSGYSCIPMDRMEFPCMITTKFNKAGQPSYHEAVII